MSMKNYEITAWNMTGPYEDGKLEWNERVRAESPADALEKGTELFREAIPDAKASGYEVHATGPW